MSMKLIIAHLAHDAYDSVRGELRDLGVHQTTISEVRVSDPGTAVTLRYRGATMQTHLRPCLKLECVVGDEQSPSVVRVLRRHMSEGETVPSRVAVLDLEELYEAAAKDELFPDDPRLDTALQ